MSHVQSHKTGSIYALAFAALCVAALSGCNSAEAPGATTQDASAANASAPKASSAPAAPSSELVGTSCVTNDPNKLCLAVNFVAYQDQNGTPVATSNDAINIINSMNQLWSQCGISFQVETYRAVDPTQFGLAFGAASQSQTEQIRSTFANPSDEFLAVTTGPWGTAVNAWTAMPGSANHGAVMESGIINYGGGIIYAHEFGHYLGLDHIADTSNLMDAVIYTSSTGLNSAQCETARKTANTYWSAMIRK